MGKRKELVLCVPAHLTFIAPPDVRTRIEVYPKVPCPECERDMHIGPRGAALVESDNADMLCMACALAAGLYNDQSNIELLSERDN